MQFKENPTQSRRDIRLTSKITILIFQFFHRHLALTSCDSSRSRKKKVVPNLREHWCRHSSADDTRRRLMLYWCNSCNECPTLVQLLQQKSYTRATTATNVLQSCNYCNKCPTLVQLLQQMSYTSATTATNVLH